MHTDERTGDQLERWEIEQDRDDLDGIDVEVAAFLTRLPAPDVETFDDAPF